METTNALYQELFKRKLAENKKMQLILVDEEVAQITASVKRRLDYNQNNSDEQTED